MSVVGCGCDDWDVNAKAIDGALQYAGVRGWSSYPKIFKYCPYCGKLLSEITKETKE